MPVTRAGDIVSQQPARWRRGEAPVQVGPERPAPRNGKGTASLALGLASLALMALLPPLALVLAVAAVVLGLMGRARALRGESTNPGQALAGIVTGAIGVVISVGLLISAGVFVVNHQIQIQRLSRCERHATTSAAQRACIREFSNVLRRGS